MADSTLAVLDAGGVRLVDPATPVLRADDLTVLRGEGVFETARVYGGTAFGLERHLARLRASALRVGVTLPADLDALVGAALAGYGDGDGSVRLVCSKGPAAAPGQAVAFALVAPVAAGSVAEREHGVDAVTLTLGVGAGTRSGAPWLLGGVKSTSYAVAMASQRAAALQGAGDAVWLSSDGEVLEGPTSAVVLVLAGEPVTPPPAEVGVLASVTVAELAERCGGIAERRLRSADLQAAEEVLLLSSVRGVAAVRRLDGRQVGDGGVGPVGARLRDLYETAVRGV